MNILIKTNGLTANENEKLLEVARKILRKRRKTGEEKIKYLVDFSEKRYVSHPDSENETQKGVRED